MVTYTLNLSGLSCMGCVKKVRNALEQASANIEIKQLDKHALTVSTNTHIDDIIQPIANLGFEAKPVWYFELSGLNCGKCVAKLQAQLETLDSSNIVALSKQSLTIESSLDVNLIQDNIEQQGFQAVLSDAPQAEIASSELNITTENKPSDPAKASTTSSPASSQSDSSIQLLIQGMTCASCVSSVEKALQSVVGVDKARVNLAEQSALVLTSLTNSDVEQPLLQAIKEAGYQGEIVEDLASTQKKQQQALQQHQALQKRNTYWALAMGAPLMLWGVLGGSMTIQNSTDQLAWGVVGLLCLWLLATAGRAFYANAYQAECH
jgi:Cu+-exporting ATPase